MGRNFEGYKWDYLPNHEAGMREIAEKKAALAKALEDYFGDEVSVDDVIALSRNKYDERIHGVQRK